MSSHLDVVISTDSAPPSFNPLDSDGLINAIQVEQMVGTLVRMHPSGRYEGYLAASWNNSEDFKTWSFKLRDNLSCEDDTPINADSFSKSLIRSIRLIKKHSQMPLIERLIGFSKIDTEEIIDGIKAIDRFTLEFRFSKPVETGFLEYLSLPYLGFYCEQNFNLDGSWKNNKKIISSASYQMDNWSGKGPLSLKLRNNWFKLSKNPPKSITIYTNKINDALVISETSFIFNFGHANDGIPATHNKVELSPTIFNALVISIDNNEWLKIANNRRTLRNEIKRIQANDGTNISSARIAHSLYPHLSNTKETDDKNINSSLKNSNPMIPLVITTAENPGEIHQYLERILLKALDNLSVPYRIVQKKKTQENMMEERRDHTKYDIRAISVDSGGGIENQLIKFMFCSKLGISFPDPSKKICQLVDRYEKIFGDVVPAEEMKKYVIEFDKILDDDAAVIPMLKTGHSWFLSENLSLDAVSPTMGIPYFDLFTIK